MSIKLIGRLSSSLLLTVIVLFVLTIAVNHTTPDPVQAAVDSNRSGSIRGALSTSVVTLPQVIKTLQFPLGIIPGVQVIAANPKTGYIYASGYEGMSIISDTQVIKNLDIPASAIEVNPATGYVYAAARDSIYILSNTQVITSLVMGGDSSQKTLRSSTQTGHVYIVDPASGIMTVVSGTQIVASYGVGNLPVGKVIDPITDYFYVANMLSGDLLIVSGTQIITSYNLGSSSPYAIGVNPATGYVYIPTTENGVLILSNTKVITQRAVGGFLNINFNPRSGLVYLNRYTDSVAISGTEVVATISLGLDFSYNFAVNPVSGYAYAVGPYREKILVLSGTDVITTLPGVCSSG
jgi:DNA-binding beta-propeller fold protein YncE